MQKCTESTQTHLQINYITKMNNIQLIHLIFHLHHKNKLQKLGCFTDNVTLKKKKKNIEKL